MDRNENDYLIVSPTKKMAVYVYKQFREYVSKLKRAVIHVQNDKQTIIIDSDAFYGEIRFVSERDYLVASVGFRGLVMSGYDLEQWLDAAEEYEKEKENGCS